MQKHLSKSAVFAERHLLGFFVFVINFVVFKLAINFNHNDYLQRYSYCPITYTGTQGLIDKQENGNRILDIINELIIIDSPTSFTLLPNDHANE